MKEYATSPMGVSFWHVASSCTVGRCAVIKVLVLQVHGGFRAPPILEAHCQSEGQGDGAERNPTVRHYSGEDLPVRTSREDVGSAFGAHPL